MKHTVPALIVLLALAASPAAAQKVYVDYDSYADFSQYKTFAWVDTNTTSLKMDYPEVDSMIKNNIEYYLVKGGMSEDLESPDVYVTYHGTTSTQTQFMTSTYGYAYGAGWMWGGYWGPRVVSGSMNTEFRKGTMMIDIWDAKKKEALFRGTIVKIHADDPMKAIKNIDDGIDKIVKKFREMRKKEGR
jgi:hypothetical protein